MFRDFASPASRILRKSRLNLMKMIMKMINGMCQYGMSKLENVKIPFIDKEIKPKIITASKGEKYLSEFITKLPPNTFINKATTGVGATTMALESKDKFIVAVPYQSLAINKKAWCDLRGIDVLVVKQGVTIEDITNFKGNKIIVVFDSLYKLTENLYNRKSFRLMVDEVHVVLTSASFRGKGMNTVINHFKEFKDFVLITATPTPELYGLKAFKNVRRVDIEWPNKEKINFIRDIVTKDDDYTVEDKLILISRQHLEGEIESNAYFFVNSVKIITKVVKALIKLDLVSSDQVNLIVAEGNNSNLKVQLEKSYSIGKPPTENEISKKLNFITSTAFEGSDFYDDNGKIYIISDGSRSHTKIDILTQLPQIAGRIRNSKLNKSIQIITVPSPIIEENNIVKFKTKITSDYNTQERLLKAQNKMISENLNDPDVYEIMQSKLIKDAELNPNYIIEDGFVEMNELYIPSQIHSWKVLHQSYVYKLNGNGETEVSEGENCGIDFNDKKVPLPPKALGKAQLGKKYNFRELFNMYLKARKEEATKTFNFKDIDIDSNPLNQNMSDHIGKVEPIFHEAYRILGAEGIVNLDFKKSKIIEAIDKKAPINNVAKYLKIKNGWYSNKDIKNRLQKFYNKYYPKLKAKSTDIGKYYLVKNKSKRVGKKLVKGVEIINKFRDEKK